MYAVSQEEFEEFIADGVAVIPGKFRERIANVAFLAEEEPAAPARRKMKLRKDESLFGLYEGIPRTARGAEYGGFVLPDRVTIFKKPIEKEAEWILTTRAANPSRGEFQNEVRRIVIDTVWHEVAHHFGLSEAAVRRREATRRGLQRRKKKI